MYLCICLSILSAVQNSYFYSLAVGRFFAEEVNKLQTEGGGNISNYEAENNETKMSLAGHIKWVVENQNGCTVLKHKVMKGLK